MDSDRSRWPVPADAPAAADLARCVHCGLCINACPTYVVTGLETESPRGRIALARAVDEGRLTMTPAVQRHWDLCLQCRACEAVCPSGVPYGRIIESVRAQVAADPKRGSRSLRLRRLALRRVFGSPSALRLAMLPARILAATPVQAISGALRVHRLVGLGRTVAGLPAGQGRPVRPGDSLPVPEHPDSSVILFTGCVMGELFGEVHRATARVLGRVGVAAEAAAGQGCCGALSAHDGDLEFARLLARRNIAALEDDERVIIVNSAGCGAALKEYGGLLAEDADWADRARRFSSRVRDFAEFLAAHEGTRSGALPARVAYQDACHLVHAQRIRQAPRELLRQIDGCELIETDGSDMCCGAAGLYSVLQPGMSAALRQRKAEQFRVHRPNIVVTANPGCQLQFQSAAREAHLPVRVMHLAEVLDLAQRGTGVDRRGTA